MMLTATPVGSRSVCSRASASAQIVKLPTSITRRSVAVRASATPDDNSTDAFSPSRRSMLLSVLAALTLSVLTGPALATQGFKQFLGYSQVGGKCHMLTGYASMFVKPAHHGCDVYAHQAC